MLLTGNKAAALLAAAVFFAALPRGESVFAQEAAVLSVEQRQLADALALRGDELAEVAGFYAARFNRPLWTDAGQAGKADALITALETASAHGLPEGRYQGGMLARVLADAVDPQSRAAAEIALTETYLVFSQDLHSGLLEPKDIDAELSLKPRRESVFDRLARVVAAADGPSLIEGLVPVHPNYQVLLAEKRRLERLVTASDAVAMVAAGAVLRPGDVDIRVAQMRARLGVVGFSQGLGNSETYDEPLAALVKLFQEHEGLEADGVVGPRTLAVLNQSDRNRLQQVLVNLERERWLNFPRGARHIQVNIPAFEALVIDDGVTVFETRTVVGRADKHRTPEFADSMTHMVINPSWNVPVSIITKEYLPQLQANNNATNRQGIQIFYKGRQIDPTRVDFTRFNAGNFPVTMRQPPGAGNALGKVKFLFPNEFDIYLHDTPSKSLFDKAVRDFSHGCVRVARPLDLAYLLLSRQSDDPEGLFAGHLNTGRETTVNLEVPVPVYITYQTVWHDEAGAVKYLEDVYGRDAKVFAALEAAGVTIDVPES